MSMTPLPSAPARSDAPATFITKADAFIAALPTFVTEANALQTDVTTKQSTASTAATNASTSATNAASSATSASTSASTATTQASNASTSATNAASSATAAAASATSAATSATNASNAAASTAVNPFVFSTTTTMADPGVGAIRFNNATVSSVTTIAIDAQTNDSGNPNVINYIATWGNSTSTNKGNLILKKSGTPGTFAIFTVTAVTNNTGWAQLAVTYVTSNGTWSNSDVAYVQFVATGDAGTLSGNAAGTIDMTAYPFNEAHGADIASASTINLDTATGNLVDVTGTTTITAITLSDGHERTVRFTAALTLTNGASLVLPSGANITTAAGDFATFRGYAAGVVRCVNYARATGKALIESVSLGANTFTGNQIYSDQQNSRAMLIDCGYTFLDKGNSGTSTQTLDYTAGSHQKITATGNHTIAFSNFSPTGNLSELLLEATNFGAYTVTFPTINWVKPDGTVTTSVSTYLSANTGRTALQSSGTDFILFWTRDAGSTVYGKLV